MRSTFLAMALVLTAPVAASAQQTGRISGVVGDSVHGAPLVGAFVTVEGLGRSAVTDSAGAFDIDTVAAGERRIAVFHPLLDTLGLTLMTPALRVVADSTTTVVIAVPSVSTVMRLKCGDESTGAVIGTVSRADDPEPPAGASVLLRWTEVQIGRAIGVRNIPRELGVPVAEDGTFRMCGIPPGVDGELFAVVMSPKTGINTDTSAAYQASFDEWPVLVIAGLVLPGSDVEAVAPEVAGDRADDPDADLAADAALEPAAPVAVLRKGRAIIAGTVVDSTGGPIAGARVWLQGTLGSATSDDAGRFLLREQPSGSGVLAARKLGLAMTELPVVISAHGRNEYTLRMTGTVPTLAEVVVQANRQIALERVGFYSRQQRRRGNFFLDVEQMDALANRASLANVLAGASNLTYRQGKIIGRYRAPRVQVSATRNISMQSSYTCVAYIVDGEYWPAISGEPSDFLLPNEVAAIEVYRQGQAPRDLPWAHYVRECETVVIWTRHKLRVP